MGGFTYGRKVVDVGGGSFLRGAGILVVAGIALVVFYSSLTRVPSGSVGVLTFFGRVTGEALPEGMHFVNPLKVNNVLSIRTQEVKESASVPSSEGLVMALDTSLLFHLSPDHAADVFQ